ncbi:MAG TPA: PHP-associated domain-containing protein, partial [Anaerolineaceae bacterium]|nr:PHP-associated domain-containing protein [Anaerolineaceae bacterium]
ILGLFVHKDIPRGLSALETVLRIGEQGGLAVAAHPMARGVHGLSASGLRALVADPDARSVLVGLEAINAGLVLQGSNAKTGPLAGELNLAQTGGSDSHVLFTVGSGITTFPGRTAADLRRALLSRSTQGVKLDDFNLLRLLAIWLPGRLWRRVRWAPLHS